MHKKILPIKGMHCRSCEILVAEALKEVPGVKNVHVKYKDQEATVYSEINIVDSVLEDAVANAGYEVGVDDSSSWISLNLADYKYFAIALVLFTLVYFVLKLTGLFNINTGSGGNPSSFGVVLLVGLTAGVSTCMAMAGGLVLGISARHKEKHPEATPAQNFRPHLFFNLGRVISYFILGGAIGLIGKVFQLSGTTLGIITIVVGLIMLTLGIQISGLFPKISGGGIALPSGIAKLLGIKKHHDKEYSHLNSAAVGALTFFLPCGFTQAMQLYAISTGSFISGALIMGIFALGTAPGLLSIGGLTSIIKGKFSSIFFKFVAIALIAMAIFNLNNGFNLTGWKIFSGQKNQISNVADPNVKLVDGVQVVSMTQTSGGYTPNKFIIKKDVPVRWEINSKDSSSCSSSILMSKFNIRKSLKSGMNIIEFTPHDLGTIKFSCSMGMYTGTFTVTDQNVSSSGAVTSSDTTATSPAAGCCGGGQSSKAAPQSDYANGAAQENIKATFASVSKDIDPNTFTVPAGRQITFEIDPQVDGQGCMSTIEIPGIIDQPVPLQKGKPIIWKFTAKKGTYQITCAMGVPRGTLKVI